MKFVLRFGLLVNGSRRCRKIAYRKTKTIIKFVRVIVLCFFIFYFFFRILSNTIRKSIST